MSSTLFSVYRIFARFKDRSLSFFAKQFFQYRLFSIKCLVTSKIFFFKNVMSFTNIFLCWYLVLVLFVLGNSNAIFGKHFKFIFWSGFLVFEQIILVRIISTTFKVLPILSQILTSLFGFSPVTIGFF